MGYAPNFFSAVLPKLLFPSLHSVPSSSIHRPCLCSDPQWANSFSSPPWQGKYRQKVMTMAHIGCGFGFALESIIEMYDTLCT